MRNAHLCDRELTWVRCSELAITSRVDRRRWIGTRVDVDVKARDGRAPSSTRGVGRYGNAPSVKVVSLRPNPRWHNSCWWGHRFLKQCKLRAVLLVQGRQALPAVGSVRHVP